MTDTQRAIVSSTLLMFALKYGWDQLSEEEKLLARRAQQLQSNLRYMYLYV